jgi:hypothetical protein
MRRRAMRIVLASTLLVLGSCGSEELTSAEGGTPTVAGPTGDTRAQCRVDEGATEAIFEIASDASGHPTPATALRAHLAEDLPGLSVPVPEELPDRGASRADDRFVVSSSTDAEVAVVLRERGRIAGRFHIERTASGGWIVSGFEICNDSYQAAIR